MSRFIFFSRSSSRKVFVRDIAGEKYLPERPLPGAGKWGAGFHLIVATLLLCYSFVLQRKNNNGSLM